MTKNSKMSLKEKMYSAVLTGMRDTPLGPLCIEASEKDLYSLILHTSVACGLSNTLVSNLYAAHLIVSRQKKTQQRFREVEEFVASLYTLQKEVIKEYFFGNIDTKQEALEAKMLIALLRGNISDEVTRATYYMRRHKKIGEIGILFPELVIEAKNIISEAIDFCKNNYVPISRKAVGYKMSKSEDLMREYLIASIDKRSIFYSRLAGMDTDEIFDVVKAGGMGAVYQSELMLFAYIVSLVFQPSKKKFVSKVSESKSKEREMRFLRPSQREFFQEVLMRGWHDTKESLYVMKNSVSRLKEKKNRGIFSSQEELVRWATNAQAKKSVIEPNFNDVERLAKFHGVVASAHRDMNKIAYYYYKVVRGEQIPSKYRRKK
jgi:hypothetical protein